MNRTGILVMIICGVALVLVILLGKAPVGLEWGWLRVYLGRAIAVMGAMLGIYIIVRGKQ